MSHRLTLLGRSLVDYASSDQDAIRSRDGVPQGAGFLRLSRFCLGRCVIGRNTRVL